MAAYSAIVSLKQDLEQLLRTHQRFSGPRFSNEKFPVLHDDLSLMDLLFKDCSGKCEDREMMIQFVNRIRQLAHIIAYYQNLDDKDFEIFCKSVLPKSKVNPHDSSSTKERLILCDRVSLMDSLLGDSSQQIYDHDTMIQFRNLFGDVARGGENYQHFFGSRLSEEKFEILIECALGKDNIYHPYDSALGKDTLQVLHEEVGLMDSLLRDSSTESYDREMMIQFQNRIANVADEVATFFDVAGVKDSVFLRFDLNSENSINTTTLIVGRKYRLKLTGVTKEVACINKELKKIHHERGVLDTAVTLTLEKGNSSTLLNPSHRSPNKDVKLVGLEKDLEAMLDCLTGASTKLQVFPVIGMGGIGKTTFSRKLYDHPLVVHQFYIRAWVTVSQEYQLKEVLLGLLSCIINLSDEVYEWSSEQLREQMYRYLKGRRYLIILDDVWDNKAWDDLRRAFPDDKNGSRIMLTSRIRDVATHASPDVPPHCLHCLSREESWELLCSKIFANGSCPHELAPIGNQIAYKCQGLPLAIVVVGGLLSKMKKTSKVWEEVAQRVSSFVMEDHQHCQSMLALSYNHLPYPLKACFLYMGVYPEDYDISSKKLICLWIAEGFIQPKKQKTLEEVAEDYLEDLIARSLVMVKRKKSNGKIKICGIHDLMRDLCLRESQKDSFLRVIHSFEKMSVENTQKYYQEFLETDLHNLRRLAFYSNIRMFMQLRVSFPFTRSFFCFEALRSTDIKGLSGIHFKLLKVVDMMHVHLLFLPQGILSLTHLRYLSLTIQNSFCVSALFRLHNLQTCIIDCEWGGELPLEFWCMTELRHLHFQRRSVSHENLNFNLSSGICPFNLSSRISLLNLRSGISSLENLQSLSMLSPQYCTKEIFKSTYNLKKLGVYETEEDLCRGWLNNLFHLKQLETLKYVFSNPFASPLVKPIRLPAWYFFPQKLTKLSLSGTSFPWEDMQKLSMLPKLEVLKLKNYAFSGAVWKLGESCFQSLKFLLIGSTNLQLWEADGSHFPSLEHLVFRHCRSLQEVPYGIGEAPLLEKIELHCCGDSAAASARKIQEEQQSLGNDLFTVYITERLQSFSFNA